MFKGVKMGGGGGGGFVVEASGVSYALESPESEALEAVSSSSISLSLVRPMRSFEGSGSGVTCTDAFCLGW